MPSLPETRTTIPSYPPPSVRSIVDLPSLGLILRGGDVRTPEGQDRPVRWVAVSELEDPCSFLEGGELLLSTGMRLPADEPKALDAYVQRLVDAGIAAYGLGVGLTHESVPQALLDAAARRGLVIVEVPENTPFIAISKTVSAMVAAQEYEATTRAFETQRDLTRAALGVEAVAAVAARLARSLAAWVLVLDPAGRVVAASPAEAAEQTAVLHPEVVALRGRGLLSSSALDLGDERVVLHPLGARGAVRGFLAVGRVTAFDRTDQSLVAVAVSLLSLAVERGAGGGDAGARVRGAALQMLVGGSDPDELPLDALGWSWLRASPLRVVRLATEQLSGVTVDELVAESSERAVAQVGEELVLVLVDDVAEIAAVEEALARTPAGGSGPASIAAVSAAWRDAGRALRAARDLGVVWHDALGGEGLIGVVDPAAARAFADSLLGPLDATGGKADLLRSTRAWLAHHGQWDVAAQELGVHRHTLRYRIRRVEEVLGRSLDDVALRAELWFALEVRAHQGD